MKSADYSKLDYDKLLDEWAEILFKKVEAYEQKRDECEMGTYKYGCYQGKHDGIMEAITRLSMLERREFNKYNKERKQLEV